MPRWDDDVTEDAFTGDELSGIYEDAYRERVEALRQMVADGECVPGHAEEIMRKMAASRHDAFEAMRLNGIGSLSLNEAMLKVGALGTIRAGSGEQREDGRADGHADLEERTGLRYVESSDDQAIFEVTCRSAIDWARHPWITPGTQLVAMERGWSRSVYPGDARRISLYAADGSIVKPYGMDDDLYGRLVNAARDVLLGEAKQELYVRSCESPVAVQVVEHPDEWVLELRFRDSLRGAPASSEDNDRKHHVRVGRRNGRTLESALAEVLTQYGATAAMMPRPGDWDDQCHGYNVPTREAFVEVVRLPKMAIGGGSHVPSQSELFGSVKGKGTAGVVRAKDASRRVSQ